ncbi:MAG: hypothetical protein LW669_10745 [Sphingobacteriales bacterium]|nr:hypothetical protein [Sphingobacteriales bacterium]
MRALVKIIFCYIFCNIIDHTAATAQIFHPKDSVRKQRVIQLGVGVYNGINHITPITPNFRYFTNDGYDKGILISLRVNLTKHFVLDANYRISEQTCMIGMQNEAFYKSFHLTGNSLILITQWVYLRRFIYHIILSSVFLLRYHSLINQLE